MTKELDHQAKEKAIPGKLIYVNSKKEATDKGQKSLSKGKEPSHLRRLKRLEKQSQTKERARRKKSKPKERRPKPTPSTLRITYFKYHRKAKLHRNIRVYERNKDLEHHLSIFSAAAEQEEWPIPIWCKMFCQTLGGATRNWFDDLDPKSVDNFKESSQKFLEEFSQQKRYAKDPIEDLRHQEETKRETTNFMDRFKSESSHIKGVPPVLSILAFMHGHGHPELVKKLNDKIPKTMDEIFKRVRAFIQG
nr:reverse transcriptase domain-containing protein [Tanacetum cinerariifolium]